jgi:ribose/xylose/arabinose/galactoside ABC-type transport system permease subunit
MQVAGPLIGLVLVLAIFGAWRPDRFLSAAAFTDIVQSNYHVGVAAVGATFVIITGGIDLSVGSTMALANVSCALALTGLTLPKYNSEQAIALAIAAGLIASLCAVGRCLQSGWTRWRTLAMAFIIYAAVAGPVWLIWYLLAGRTIPPQSLSIAIAVGILVGALVGTLNGLLITCASLPPFIVTLATLGAVRGLALYITDGITISALPPEIGKLHFSEFLFGLPPNVWITLAIVLLGAPILHFTILGRYAYAIGSNERTARLCGVRVELWKTLCYIIAGATAGLGGVMMTGKFNTGQPTEFKGTELQVIAAVVIGGTSLFGGEGTIIGSFLGVLMLNVLYSGCNIAGISSFVQEIFIGGTIVLAAAMDRFRHLRR